MIKPHLAGRQGVLFGLYVVALCSRIFITVKLADLSGRLAAYFGARRWAEMFSGQAEFGLWCMLAAGVTASMKFLEKQNAISLRQVIFNHIAGRYLDPAAPSPRFFHQRLDDAPARLTSDVEVFSSEAMYCVGHVLKPSIDILHLTWVLTQRLGLVPVGFFYAFFVFSDASLRRVRQRALPTPLKECALEQQALEARLRARLNAIHLHREQIAMQCGCERELTDVSACFAQLTAGSTKEALQYSFLDILSSYTLKYGGLMTAFSVLIPPVYLDPTLSGEDITAAFMSNSSLLGSLASAVKDLAESLTKVPRIKGLAKRVYELERELSGVDRSLAAIREFDGEETGSLITRTTTEDASQGIVVRGAGIRAPTAGRWDNAEGTGGSWLYRGVSFSVAPGQHTVLRGPNGAGKSSLFRAMTGLWPAFTSGDCGGAGAPRILVPKSLFVLPQNPFFPLASLACQITYPVDSATLRGDPVERGRLLELMEVVGLAELIHGTNRYKLDDVQDWDAVLSGGQKQRLVWARLFFHRPRYALLDEATSAISHEMIDALFLHAHGLGITLLSISHSAEVDKHHKQAVNLEGGGGSHGSWSVTELVV